MHIIPHTFETKQLISISRRGKLLSEDNHKWKGDFVGYNALHAWINRTLGKPETCERCDRTGLTGRKIHWANVSGEYKRDKSDWIRLCAKCHLAFDGYKRWMGYIKPHCSCGKIAFAKLFCRYHYQRQYRGLEVYV